MTGRQSFSFIGFTVIFFIFLGQNVMAVCTSQKYLTFRVETLASSCIRSPSTVFAHPARCHQYFNCSGNSPLAYGLASVLETQPHDLWYLYECPYLQLFNGVSLQCDDYGNVQCGQKYAPLDACEYTQYLCRSSDCQPCNETYPSCRNLSDGLHVIAGREWTPYFISCRDQRLITNSTCPQDAQLNVAQVFSPDVDKCVSPIEVAPEHLGYFFNCTSRADGFYADDVTNRRYVYFQCSSQLLAGIFQCEDKKLFNVQRSKCTGAGSPLN